MTKLLKKSFIFISIVVLLLNLLFLTKVNIVEAERYSGYGKVVPYSTILDSETVNYTRREL